MRACAAACASGVVGAIGFAAAKATDPGAGATDSFEAQQPILVRKKRAAYVTETRCVGVEEQMAGPVSAQTARESGNGSQI